ncbi:MAG: NAD-dependent epimerase/dehydratase family protein, partial [Anaerolineae bacterium]|nr:NAD-dependent epimerase/dehydratase family protein [Anaerolineae bacterium]
MAELRCAFVTGGDGFVGSHLLRQLLIRGVQVRALTRRGAAAGR